jgi:hypothetical protein
MLKKSFFTFAILLVLSKAQAQLDVSINPLGLLFGNYGVSAEKGLSESFGVELTADYSSQKYELASEKVSSSGTSLLLIKSTAP